MKLAKSQRRNSSFFKAQTQLVLIAFLCHSEVRSALNRHFRAWVALGSAVRHFNGASQGFQAAHHVGPTSAISFF